MCLFPKFPNENQVSLKQLFVVLFKTSLIGCRIGRLGSDIWIIPGSPGKRRHNQWRNRICLFKICWCVFLKGYIFSTFTKYVYIYFIYGRYWVLKAHLFLRQAWDHPSNLLAWDHPSFPFQTPIFLLSWFGSNGETSTSTRFCLVGDSGEDEAGSRYLEKVHAGAQDGPDEYEHLAFWWIFLRFWWVSSVVFYLVSIWSNGRAMMQAALLEGIYHSQEASQTILGSLRVPRK